MFSFSEILLIALVALVVIGPERLPTVARTVGLLIGRTQRHATRIKKEIELEIRLEEIQNLRDAALDAAREVEQTALIQSAGIHNEVTDAVKAVASELEQATRLSPPTADPVSKPTLSTVACPVEPKAGE